MAILDFKTGTSLSKKEIKARTLAATGWTTEQYNKEYDKLRNRVRSYEKLQGTHVQPVNELLYLRERSKKKYGGAYRPSALLESIEAAPSVSSGTSAEKLRASNAVGRQVDVLERQFAGFAKKSKAAAELLREARETIKSGGKVDVGGLRRRLTMEAESVKRYQKDQEKQKGLPRGSYKGGYDSGSRYESKNKKKKRRGKR